MNKTATIICLIGALLLQRVNVKGQSPSSEMKKADSLYLAQDWPGAKKVYDKILSDTSSNSIAWNRLGFSNYNISNYADALKDYKKALANKPIPPVKASAYSRIARINALQNKADAAISNIDSAIVYGYASFGELDSLKDFASIRNNEDFQKEREKVYLAAYPCMGNPKARVFDFWAGEWNVYVTGTQTLGGHSLVQVVSGGCAILENWDSTGGASTGKSLNFIDAATNMWKQCWIGSYPNGQQDFVSGEYKDGAMRFTFTTTDAKGNKLMGRFIFYNQGPDKVRQFSETSADDGKTWTTNYDLTYVRIKNSASLTK
jgi:hypothetical protein